MGYSAKQKMLVLQKVLPPSSRPVHEVSKDTGISVRTIYTWMKQFKGDTLRADAVEESIPRFKTALEKFTLVLESKGISEAEYGAWLRRKGIHTEHLHVWEQELAHMMTRKPVDVDAICQENKELKQELKRTRIEKRRVEQALAEMSALYALKKKAEALWEESEED